MSTRSRVSGAYRGSGQGPLARPPPETLLLDAEGSWPARATKFKHMETALGTAISPPALIHQVVNPFLAPWDVPSDQELAAKQFAHRWFKASEHVRKGEGFVSEGSWLKVDDICAWRRACGVQPGYQDGPHLTQRDIATAANESEASISDYVMVGNIPAEQRVKGRSYRDHRDFMRVAKHFPGARGNHAATVALALEWLKRPEPKATPNEPFTTNLDLFKDALRKAEEEGKKPTTATGAGRGGGGGASSGASSGGYHYGKEEVKTRGDRFVHLLTNHLKGADRGAAASYCAKAVLKVARPCDRAVAAIDVLQQIGKELPDLDQQVLQQVVDAAKAALVAAEAELKRRAPASPAKDGA